jgi:hypothetical protein
MDNARLRTIASALAAACLVAGMSCTKNGISLPGGGTDVSNASVSGRIVTANGKGVANAQVKLICGTFLPYRAAGSLADTATPVYVDTTDEGGLYDFPDVKTNTYNIQAVHLTDRTRMLRGGIAVQEHDTLDVPVDSLRVPGSVAVILRPGLHYAPGGFLFVPGTDIYKKVTSTSSAVIMDSVPSGLVSSIYYSDSSSPTAYSSVSNTIDVMSGKTSAAGTAFCLVVTGNAATLSPSDSLIVNRLQTIGVNVIVKADTAVTVADTSGKDIILIAPTATSPALQTFITVSVSLIVCQTRMYPLLNMTGTVQEVDYAMYDKAAINYTDSVHQNNIEMRDVMNPISPNMAGTQMLLTFPQYMVWGMPTLKAKVVASVYGNINRIVIFTYEAGEMMVSVTTPGRRVGLSFHEDIFPSLNSFGWTLFDNSVFWALKVR